VSFGIPSSRGEGAGTWFELTEEGCRYGLRRGIYAYKRMLKRQQETKDMGIAVFAIIILMLAFGLLAIVQCRF